VLIVAVTGASAAPPSSAKTPPTSNRDLPARVIILANRDDPGSLRIARHYATARGVPEANIFAFPMPSAEAITWHDFVSTIWEPFLRQLVDTHWIDAARMDLVDSAGRTKYAASGHHIAALVVCRGVPLKIEHDPALYAEVMPFTAHAEFRTNEGAVDAELSLLALPNYPINAFLPNPLFQNKAPYDYSSSQVVKVSRLDGPTADDAMGLIDHAIEAEREGLRGRAYIDFGDRDAIGNEWLKATAKQIEGLGFDIEVDENPPTFPATARMDAPALYFGWYTGQLDGPFALPGFRFPAGAIALHIHSYSAGTVRSDVANWVGPLIARGVTATFGNVHEPYLQTTLRPDLLMEALARGDDLVDAAYYATPYLSWQQVIIGDPLYRPFAVALADQLKRSASARDVDYVGIRRAHQLDSAGKSAEALALLQRLQREHPTIAVALELSRRLRREGDTEAAANALRVPLKAAEFVTNEWGLVRELARSFAEAGRRTESVATWRVLLDDPKLPRSLREPWLREAITAAEQAGDAHQVDLWKTELESLSAPVTG
jgi:uncharacterized protein (TIGR03790 family)